MLLGRKTKDKGRPKAKKDPRQEKTIRRKRKLFEEQHCEGRRVLQFEGMAEGGQRVVSGVTRGEEWSHTVANVVSYPGHGFLCSLVSIYATTEQLIFEI